MKKISTLLFTFVSLFSFGQMRMPHVQLIADQQISVKPMALSRAAIDTVAWAPQDQPELYRVPDPNTGFHPPHVAGYVSVTDQLLSSDSILGEGFPGSITGEDAQIFMNKTKIRVVGAKFVFGAVEFVSADSQSLVVFKLYKLDATFTNSQGANVPAPGTLVSTDTVPIYEIHQLRSGVETLFSGATNVYFPTPLTVDADTGYALAVDINNIDPLDTLGMFTSGIGQPPVKEKSLLQFFGLDSWSSFADPRNGWGADVDLAIFPIVDFTLFDTSAVALCNDSTYNFNGTILNAPGTYRDTTTSSIGYDSISTIHLFLAFPDTGSTNDTICAGGTYDLYGAFYTAAGTYTAHIPNHLGCDSTLLVTLAIGDSVHTNVIASGDTLMAVQSDAVYQWISCSDGSPVSGATGRTLIVQQSGNYEVLVSKYHCADTSSCYDVLLGIDELRNISFSMQPNPARDICTIYPGDIKGGNWSAGIYNLQGQLVRNLFTNEQNLHPYSFNTQTLSTGLYLVKVTGGNGATGIKKLVIE